MLPVSRLSGIFHSEELPPVSGNTMTAARANLATLKDSGLKHTAMLHLAESGEYSKWVSRYKRPPSH